METVNHSMSMHSVSMEDRLVAFIIRTNWILVVGLFLAGLALMDALFAWSILIGGLIVAVNFHMVHRLLKKTLQPHLRPSSAWVAVKLVLRFAVLFLILYFLISRRLVDPLGLIAGLSVVVISLMLATLRAVKNLLFGEEAI